MPNRFFVSNYQVSKNSGNEPVSSASWKLDPEELEKVFSDKTKIIILNTPHNPTGKVFTVSELEMIANLCKKYNVVCLADEVYEWLVYKPAKHVRIGNYRVRMYDSY